jgi:hypothetical protein
MLIEAPRKRIEPGVITANDVVALVKDMRGIVLTEELIHEIKRRLEEISRVSKYLSSERSKNTKFKAQQRAVVKAANRARPHSSFYDAHFCKILRDLEIWEKKHRETRLMVQIGNSSVPVERLFPSATSAKPQHYLVSHCIHGIWRDLLGQTFAAEPSANLTTFATKVFGLLEGKYRGEPAIRTRLKRYFDLMSE